MIDALNQYAERIRICKRLMEEAKLMKIRKDSLPEGSEKEKLRNELNAILRCVDITMLEK